MSYNKDLVFLDLEWLTHKRKQYVTQIGIIRLDWKTMSVKKSRLFKIKTTEFNAYQLGLIGAKSQYDKGTVTINKKVIHDVFELLNDSIIHIYYDPANEYIDDVIILKNAMKFPKPLNYELVKVYHKCSLRRLYAGYKKQLYVNNMFHNALEDAQMLREIFLNNITTPNPHLPFYEYSCNYDTFCCYSANKSLYSLIKPNSPQEEYIMTNLKLVHNGSYTFKNYSLNIKRYKYEFDLINKKTLKILHFNNDNIQKFIQLSQNILITRDKVSTSKIDDLLHTIFLENHVMLVLLTRNKHLMEWNKNFHIPKRIQKSVD